MEKPQCDACEKEISETDTAAMVGVFYTERGNRNYDEWVEGNICGQCLYGFHEDFQVANA